MSSVANTSQYFSYLFAFEALCSTFLWYTWFIQELYQAIEQINSRLNALSSLMKRDEQGHPLLKEMTQLKRQQQELMGKAKEKQLTLESLVALWQR